MVDSLKIRLIKEAAEYPNSRIGKATKTLLMIMMEFPTILVGLFGDLRGKA